MAKSPSRSSLPDRRPRAGFVLSPLVALAAAACGAERPVEPVAKHEAAPRVTAVAPPVAPSASELPPVASAPPPVASADTGPSACPADMILIDGDYCLDLEENCTEKFYAEQNHLWVCKAYSEPTKCVGGTRHVRYCIDKYEFPNREGVRPMVMQNFYQAEVHCAKRGKRMCTESEWTKACEGPDNKPFPYGYTRDPEICNGDKPWDQPDKQKVEDSDPKELERLWQGKVSGSQPKCVSDYGVFDMPGNADELAASETHKAPTKIGNKTKDFGQDFDNVTTGGPWYYGVRNACRPKIYTHDESFAYYYLSWRCCAESDGKPTDPRAPKQIDRNWTFDKVKNIADHSWKLPYREKEPGDP